MVTVRARLYANALIQLALLCAIVAVAIMAIGGQGDAMDDVVGDDLVVFEILNEVKEANLLNRIYWREAIAGTEAEIGNLTISFANRASAAKALEQETLMAAAVHRLVTKSANLDAQDQKMIRGIEAGMRAFLATSPALHTAVKSGSGVAEAGRSMAEARDKRLMPAIAELGDHKRAELHEAAEAAAEARRGSVRWVIATSGIAAAAAVILSGLLARSIALPLTHAAEHAQRMASGAFGRGQGCREKCTYGRTINCNGKTCEIGKVSWSMDQMRTNLATAVRSIQEKAAKAHGYSRNLADSMKVAVSASSAQAEKVMQVSAATEELNVSISEVASSIREVVGSSSSSSGEAQSGMALLQRTRAAMAAIVESTGQSNAAIAAVQESTHSIRDLTRQIQEVAEQTNLLALNAAIEAARAGESGRGFAVVADEVRKLAETTAGTSDSIQALATGMNSKVQAAATAIHGISTVAAEGEKLSSEMGNALRRIVDETRVVEAQVSSISHAATEQRTAADSTAQAMEEITALTEENDVALGQIDVTTQELRTLADGLLQTVQGFEVDDPGTQWGAHPRPAIA